MLLLISNSVSSIKYSTTPSSNLQTLPMYLMINGGKKKDLGLFTMIRAFWLTLINPEVSIIINIDIHNFINYSLTVCFQLYN
jgi:hypothetical protein